MDIGGLIIGTLFVLAFIVPVIIMQVKNKDRKIFDTKKSFIGVCAVAVLAEAIILLLTL